MTPPVPPCHGSETSEANQRLWVTFREKTVASTSVTLTLDSEVQETDLYTATDSKACNLFFKICQHLTSIKSRHFIHHGE